MPARKRKIRRLPLKEKKKRPYIINILIMLSFLGIFFYLSHGEKYWQDNKKISILINGSDIDLVTLDPQADEMTNIIIPGNTQVEVAEGRGVYLLKNVRKLGRQEKLDDNLLARTVTKHFKLPVYVWADAPAEGFVRGGGLALLKAALIPYKTNMSASDKIKIALFSLSLKNTGRREINLTESVVLKETRLEDGSEGFLLKSEIPDCMKAIFANPDLNSRVYRVMITDRTGKAGYAEVVNDIITVYGGKIVAINKEAQSKGICELKGKDKKFLKVITEMLPCYFSTDIDSDFDLEIILGEKFVEHF